MLQPLPAENATPAMARPSGRRIGTIGRLVALALAALFLRVVVFAPASIPSESMLPTLQVGDYLIVAKWPYGWSRYSLPFARPQVEGRLLGRLPKRGDVVVFKAPPDNETDFVKRVIGLPGDSVQISHGKLILNGQIVPQRRDGDFVIAATANYDCPDEFAEMRGRLRFCRFVRSIESLPGGPSYPVLDRGATLADDSAVFFVPPGHLFLMGDNRDVSADSRFPPVLGRGIGFVPIENLEGRASFLFFSTNGSAAWLKPWTWFTATRWSRLGKAL